MTEVRAIDTAAPARTLGRTVHEYAALSSSLLLLGLLCLGWSALTLPLYALLPRTLGRRVGRYGITAAFRLYTRWLVAIGAYRLDLHAIDALGAESGLILAPNHPSLLDALLILSRHSNLACVMKSQLMDNVLLGPGARLACYTPNDSPLHLVRAAVADLRGGGTLLLFPEGTRTTRVPLNALTRSIGVIARHAAVPVQTLLIETDSPFLRKGCPLWSRPTLPITVRVRLGRRFEPPRDVEAFMLELERYYRSELQPGRSTCR
jgi:1-acyl-sn-glycerol-3-phosphate acyltransferase